MPALQKAVAGSLGRPLLLWAIHVPPVHERRADVGDFPGVVVGEALGVADVHHRDLRVKVEEEEARALAIDLHA
eukprot:945826-Lingulodinium_polyedra.AAC.1